MKKVELKISSWYDIKKVSVANIPVFIIIAFLVFVSYINSINGEFVSDDIPGILENPYITDLSWAIKKTEVQIFMQSLIVNIFGFKQAVFHLSSILLHLINIYLFFLIIYNIFDKKIAGIASIIFAVHPLVSETVIWISAQNYLINTFFLFIFTIIFLIYKKTQQKKYLNILLLSYSIIALTSENYWILIVPFFITGINFLLLGEKVTKAVNYKIFLPIFIVAGISFGLMGGGRLNERVTSLMSPDATPYLNRLPYTFYMPIELMLYPKNLTLYHEGELITKFKYKFMTAVFVTFIGLIIYLLKKHPGSKIGSLILLAYLSILPVFSPIQVAWFTAERYLYVATGLFGVIIAIVLLRLDGRWPKKNIAIILLSIITIIYTVRTIIRSEDWTTRKKLWLSTEKAAPYSQRVHNNLGDVYGVEGDWQRSLEHFAYALKIDPNYSEAMHNMGNTYLAMKDFNNAEKLYKKSIEISPYLYQSYYKLGVIYFAREMYLDSQAYFEKCLEIQPGFEPAIQALQILQQKKQ